MTMKLLGCGGAGINIVKKFLGKSGEGFADLDICMLDTSRSNMPKDINEDNIYLFDGLDGSGKLRASNYSVISERAREIVQRVKPGDVTVVVHSASGGSGSVLAPVLISELLKREVMVMVVAVGSSDSRIEVENTIKTLKSYAIISQKNERPINMIYAENTREMGRGAVDKAIETNIILASLFFSGQNRELDKSDLRNFLDYHKVTSFAPKLTMVDFCSGGVSLERDQALVSAVSLTDENASTAIDQPLEYQATGFITTAVKEAVKVDMPIHMVTVANYFGNVIERLEKQLRVIDEARSAVIEKSIVSNQENYTDTGLVL